MTSSAYRRGGEPVSGPGEDRDGGVGADEGRGEKGTSTAIRTVLSTSPVPAPSSTNSFLISGVIALDARRMSVAAVSAFLPWGRVRREGIISPRSE